MTDLCPHRVPLTSFCKRCAREDKASKKATRSRKRKGVSQASRHKS